jgi:hypothetical protein
VTEEEWLASDDPEPMFDLLPADASDRKLRLFGAACCRHVEEHLWGGIGSHFAIKIAEEYADRLTTEEELRTAQQAVESRLELYPGEPVYDASFWACSRLMNESAWRCAFFAANCSTRPFDGKGPERDAEAVAARTAVTRTQAAFLRDIFGNPFRPVAVEPAWLTSTVVELARGSTATGRSTDCPSWPTRCKTPDVAMMPSCRTAAVKALTFAAAGWLTCYWGRSNP